MKESNQKSGHYLFQSDDGIILGRIARLTKKEVTLSDVWKIEPKKWNPIRIGPSKTYNREDLLLISGVF